MASTHAGYHTKPVECLRVLWQPFQDLAVEGFRAVEIARLVLLGRCTQRGNELVLQCTVCIIDGARVGTVICRGQGSEQGLEMSLVIPPSSNRPIVNRLPDLPATGGRDGSLSAMELET